MFNVGGPEILVIGLLALLILGPDRLPGALRTVGRFLGELRRVSTDAQQELRDTLDTDTMKESVQALRDTVGIGRSLVDEAIATAGAVTATAGGITRPGSVAASPVAPTVPGADPRGAGGTDVPAPDGAASEGNVEVAVGGTDVPPPAAQVPDVLVDDTPEWER